MHFSHSSFDSRVLGHTGTKSMMRAFLAAALLATQTAVLAAVTFVEPYWGQGALGACFCRGGPGEPVGCSRWRRHAGVSATHLLRVPAEAEERPVMPVSPQAPAHTSSLEAPQQGLQCFQSSQGSSRLCLPACASSACASSRLCLLQLRSPGLHQLFWLPLGSLGQTDFILSFSGP